MVVSTGWRRQGLIRCSKGNYKTSFLYSAEQTDYVTVGPLKTTVLDVYNCTFYLPGHPANYPGLRVSPFFPRFNEDFRSLLFLHGILELWLHGQSRYGVPFLVLKPPRALERCGGQHVRAAHALGRGQVRTG